MQPVPCAGKRVTGAKRAKTCKHATGAKRGKKTWNRCHPREKTWNQCQARENMKPVPWAGKRSQVLKPKSRLRCWLDFAPDCGRKPKQLGHNPLHDHSDHLVHAKSNQTTRAEKGWPTFSRPANDCQSKPAVSSCTAGLHEHNSVWRFPLPIYRDNQWRKWGGEWFFVVLLIQFLHVCDRVAWITPHLATRDADTTRQSVGDLVRWVSYFTNKPCSSFRIFLSSVYTQTGYFCMRFSSEQVTKVSSTVVSLKRSWIQHFVCKGLLKKLLYSSSYFWVSLKRSWFVNQNVTGICGVWGIGWIR